MGCLVCPHHSWSGLCSSFHDAPPLTLAGAHAHKVFHPNVQMIDETERVPFHRRWELKRYQDFNPRPNIQMVKFKPLVRKRRVLEVSAVFGQYALITALPNCFLRLFANNWGYVWRHSSFFTNLIPSYLPHCKGSNMVQETHERSILRYDWAEFGATQIEQRGLWWKTEIQSTP